MKGKEKTLFVLALLLLVGLTGGYIANTYARYASVLPSKTGTTTVARWGFKNENKEKEITVNLAETYDKSTLDGGKIAPGTKGSFNIQLVNETTETGVDFTVTLSSISNVPTNLKFYTDDTRSTGLELAAGSKITGQLAAKDKTGVSVPIYWEWKLGESTEVDDTTNIADTTDGETPKDLTIGLSVVGVQTAPSQTAITSKVNSWSN